MEKISMVDTPGKEEQQAIFKVIDLAISNKKMNVPSVCFIILGYSKFSV